MWTKECIKDRIKGALRFWLPFMVVCFMAFGVFVVYMERRQTALQEETLVRTKVIETDQVILKEIRNVQKTIVAQQEILIRNQEMLKSNRELWTYNFEELQKKLEGFKRDFDSHTGEWERFKETGKK
jgi:hypothetical protein